MATHAEAVHVRGFIDRVVVSALAPDAYLSLRALATYSGLSVKTLRGFIDLPADTALPCYRLPGAGGTGSRGGKLLVRRGEFDTWMERFRTYGRPGLNDALRDLGLS